MLKSVFKECFIIMLAVFLLALISNFIRPDGLPLLTDRKTSDSQNQAPGAIQATPFDEAVRMFHSRKVLFLDARSPEDFQKGHIKGAVNLPDYRFDEVFGRVAAQLDEAEGIITYCDGEECVLGLNLARKLSRLGYNNVTYISNGWTTWQQHNLPIAGNGF